MKPKTHSVVEPRTLHLLISSSSNQKTAFSRASNFSEFISCKAVAKLRAAEWYKFASITARMELIQWRTYNMEWIHQCYNFFKKKKWRRSSRHDDTHKLHNNPNDDTRRPGPDQAQQRTRMAPTSVGLLRFPRRPSAEEKLNRSPGRGKCWWQQAQ